MNRTKILCIYLFLITILLLSCKRKIIENNTSKINKDTKIESEKIKFNSDSFKVEYVLFLKKSIDTNLLSKFQYNRIPIGLKRLINLHEIRFELTFHKSYYSYDSVISNSLLKSQSFFKNIIISDLILNAKDTTNNAYYELIRKNRITFSKKKIKNYGICDIGIIDFFWDNSTQKQIMVLINNERKTLSIWNYDDFKFDNEGNISSLFRLKDWRTWYYYQYDFKLNCFVPIAHTPTSSRYYHKNQIKK